MSEAGPVAVLKGWDYAGAIMRKLERWEVRKFEDKKLRLIWAGRQKDMKMKHRASMSLELFVVSFSAFYPFQSA